MQVNSPKLAKSLKAKSGEFLQASMFTPVHVVAIYLAVSEHKLSLQCPLPQNIQLGSSLQTFAESAGLCER